MRTSLKIMMAATATAIGSLAFAATPAMASVTAPYCESGLSTLTCGGATGTAPFTWTITDQLGGTSYSFATSAHGIKIACGAGRPYIVTYSYVSGGVTQTSNPAYVLCQSAPYQ